MRVAFFEAVAVLALVGTSVTDASCGCSGLGPVADLVTVAGADAVARLERARLESVPASAPSDVEWGLVTPPAAAAAPAAAVDGGSGGETPVVPPRPCPTYASPEAMMAAAASS